MSYPQDVQLLDEMRVVLRLEKDILPVLSSKQEIEKALKEYYGIGAETIERMGNEVPRLAQEEVSISDLEDVQSASVIRFVNQIFLEAYKSRATDIHIEPYQDDLRVRYRIDGVLHEAKVASDLKRFQAALISRVKIMADLSITEKRLPQDGRIKVRVEGQDMDLRISTLPTPFGESVTVRLLTSLQLLDLKLLGFVEKDLDVLESQISKPHGIIFLTGPTGSGKTTTLYAFLKRINKSDRKIITIEDPIEYQMRGITQMQVMPKIGLTFAQGLRSMLRHDPDIMMVGEVRDFETAEVAIRVALTGHLVFSTLHTNDAAAASTRLLDIGVEAYLIASSVRCIIAQRLVRLICLNCKREVELKPEVIAEFDLRPKEEKPKLYEGFGCKECNDTGYRGRTAIYEIIPVTEEIRRLILERSPAHLIRDKAIVEGMITLRQNGWQKNFTRFDNTGRSHPSHITGRVIVCPLLFIKPRADLGRWWKDSWKQKAIRVRWRRYPVWAISLLSLKSKTRESTKVPPSSSFGVSVWWI